MAVEIAGAYLHWPPPLPTRHHLSAKTVALAISALLHSPSKLSPDRHIPFLGTTFHLRTAPRPGGKIASSIPSPEGENDEQFALQKMEWRASNSFRLPLSLRIIKRKKKHWEESHGPPSSSVNKAFSSMVFIVGELQSHAIRMRKERFLSDRSQMQGTLARVHGELHASFAWLFQRVFSSTPTLMLYLMLLLANFTVFSISRDATGRIAVSTEVVSTAWKAMVEESDGAKVRLFVSPVTAVSEPEDLSVYSATELSYRAAIAERPDDALFLANFAQFLYTVYRDHDR